MNTLFKRLSTIVVAFCLVLIATDGMAVKPVKPPPDDPCLGMGSFSPDYAFYRGTGNKKNPGATVYLADSATGCEKELVHFSTLGENGRRADIRYLKYSSILEQDHTFGRVIWRSTLIGVSENIWSQDFYIAGADIVPVDEPRQILVNDDYGNQSIRYLDLSPDTATLAFNLSSKAPEELVTSLRMIDINYCRLLPGGCDFSEERAVVLDETNPETEFTQSIGSVSWGPIGTRIYYLSTNAGNRNLQFVEFEAGWEEGAWPPDFVVKNLYSTLTQPEFNRMRELAAGIKGDREYLSVVLPHEATNCGYVYLIDVANCENPVNPVCFTDVAFTGQQPSWTKDGVVIHDFFEYGPGSTVCGVLGWTVGAYDGETAEALTQGLTPDAAGGLPQ